MRISIILKIISPLWSWCSRRPDVVPTVPQARSPLVSTGGWAPVQEEPSSISTKPSERHFQIIQKVQWKGENP